MKKYSLISELTTIQQSQSTDILIEVQHERKKQDEKWGVQNHAPFAWLAILGEEVGEANKHALQAHFSGAYGNSDNAEYERQQLIEYRKELIQIAAVAAAMIESIDRNYFNK